MKIHPRKQTRRLSLRPFVAEDAAPLAACAGDPEVAATMLDWPDPFSEAIAKATIAGNAAAFQSGRSVHFAVAETQSSILIGSVELLGLDSEHQEAELRGFITRPAWGYGYGTEAAIAVIDLGFESLGLNRIWARHLARDRISAALLKKAGLRLEGVLREQIKRGDLFEDVAVHGVLRADLMVAPEQESD